MGLSIQELDGGKVLHVNLTGKLTTQDYEHFVPEIDRVIQAHKKVRILVDMHDFHGWTAGAIWQDTKFGLRHFSDIERLAMVGDKSWEHGMALFCKPFTGAKVRYFDRSNAAQAEAWVAETPSEAKKAADGN